MNATNMNIILSNPIISDFLSQYPQEKHINCLLGIILLGIYNMKTFSIDFDNILNQIERKKPLTSSQLTIQTLKSELSELKNSSYTPKVPEDTPRFHIKNLKSDKRSFSFKNITETSKVLKKNENQNSRNRFPFKKLEPQHAKTPSIVNPEIIPGYLESDVLKIADQFLNGRFVNEYCNVETMNKQKAHIPKLGIGTNNSEKSENRSRPTSTGLNSNSHSGRYNSFSVMSGLKSTRGDRNQSYFKFW